MRKFKIPVLPTSTPKSIRFPNDVIEEIEEKLIGTDCTFSKFIVEACKYVIKELNEENKYN